MTRSRVAVKKGPRNKSRSAPGPGPEQPCGQDGHRQVQQGEKHQPCLEKQQPRLKNQQACLEKQQPCLEKQQPCLEKQQPCLEKQQSCLEKQQSCLEKEQQAQKNKQQVFQDSQHQQQTPKDKDKPSGQPCDAPSSGAPGPAMGKDQQKSGQGRQGPAKHEVQPLVPDPLREKDSSPRKFSPLFRQVLAAAGPVMATVSSGMTTGYSAVLLPQLEHVNSTIPITTSQASWIASLAPLPMALGCLLSGLMLDRLGRRRSQLVICMPFTIGWVLLAVARDLPAILGGRFLTGLCVGLVGPPSLIYIGETADPAHRGLLLAAISLAVAMGILVAHVLGTVLHWRLTAWLCAAAPLACIAFLCPSPESPVWLASKGKLAEASRAFRWLRGFDEAASLELQGLLAKHGAVAPPPGASTPLGRTTPPAPSGVAALPLWRQLLHRSFLKPFVIMNIFFFIMQFSGVNAVAFYTVTIMKDVGGGMDEYLATIILDVVRVLMSCVACVLLRRVGRRPLAVLSAAATGVSLMGLAALLAFGDAKSHPWLPTTLLVSYITSVSLGLVPLPWVMAGEVFPGNLRGVGGGATSAFAFLFFFAVVKTGPALFATFTPAGAFAFAVYGCVALTGAVFLLVFLPETKNRTLQQIEEEMAGDAAPDKGIKDVEKAADGP